MSAPVFPTAGPIIAQGTEPGEVFSEILPWLLVLLGVVIVGAILAYFLRPSGGARNKQADAGFTLQDLRELHGRGDLSDEEFERARAAMIEHLAPPGSENSEEVEETQDEASS